MLDTLTRRISGVFASLRGKGRLSEDDVNQMLREIRVALLEADVNYEIAKAFVESVRTHAVGADLYGSLSADQTLIKIVRDELVDLLGAAPRQIAWAPSPPTVILMCGLQGSGKTTTSAKLARWLTRSGKKPLLAACDVQRPAAVKQLQVLGESLDIPVFFVEGSTPEQIAQKSIEHARHHFLDVVIVDTAGRTTLDAEMMAQLTRVARAVKPQETLLVVDATTGQEAVSVARAFGGASPLTGVVFSKMDGDSRGGAVLSVRAATGVPVRFLGEGEQTEALAEFSPSRVAERILGMGDVLGIIEKAEEAVDKASVSEMQGRIKSGRLDFTDMLEQFKMVRKMGPLKNVMKMIPGLTANLPEEALDQLDDGRMDRIEAIVLSMTPGERTNPDILNGSRRRRIAVGSGTTPQEVNQLVDQLYVMRKQMKQFAKLEKRLGKRRRR